MLLLCVAYIQLIEIYPGWEGQNWGQIHICIWMHYNKYQYKQSNETLKHYISSPIIYLGKQNVICLDNDALYYYLTSVSLHLYVLPIVVLCSARRTICGLSRHTTVKSSVRSRNNWPQKTSSNDHASARSGFMMYSQAKVTVQCLNSKWGNVQ